MSDVTPASKALPPLRRISNAAAVVSGCPVETPPVGPITAGLSTGARRSPPSPRGPCCVETGETVVARVRTTSSARDRVAMMRVVSRMRRTAAMGATFFSWPTYLGHNPPSPRDAFARFAHRPVRSDRLARSRRHGRGLSCARYAARARRRTEDPAGGVRGRRRAPRAVRPRGPDACRAQPSAHRPAARRRGLGCQCGRS